MLNLSTAMAIETANPKADLRNLTSLEEELLEVIHQAAPNWSGTPYVYDVLDAFSQGSKVGRGVLSSLSKKGLIGIQPAMHGDEAYCWIEGLD